MPQLRAISANISGRVHGVGFRYTTQTRANDLGLTGWVRNDRDGTVSVWAQGPPDGIKRLVDYLNVGPPAARVTAANIEEVAPDTTVTSFRVTY